MKALAQDTLFGEIRRPTFLSNFGDVDEGLGKFLNIIFQTLIVIAGIYALFNFILAGYAFMGAGNDPKKVEAAWAKIYQTAIGLLFAAGAFLLAAIFGKLIFGSYTFLLKPTIPTPGDL